MNYLDKQYKKRRQQLSQRNATRPTTKGMDLGKSEAENEQWKGEWFLDCFNWDEQLLNGRYIFVGRKGTGKSAIVRHIQDEQQKNQNDLSCRIVNDSDFQFESILQNDSDHIELLYEWLILVNLVECILKSPIGGDSIPAYTKLKDFFADNRGLVEITRHALQSERKENTAGLNLKALSYSKAHVKEYTNVNYINYIPLLREAVVEVLKSDLYKEHTILLLFDNLDKDFSLVQPKHKKRIIELVRVTKDYNTNYLRDTTARVILFLRDDVYRETKSFTNDSAKIYSSSVYHMKWYDRSPGTVKETDTFLRKFINKRLKIVFSNLGVNYDKDDPWQTLVDEKAAQKEFNKTAFKFILDLTFYRPRDLLLFFSCLDDKSFLLPLSPDDIHQCALLYLSENMDELKSELAIIYNEQEVRNYIGFLKDFADEICTRASKGLSENRVKELIRSHHMAAAEFERMQHYWLIVPYNSEDDSLFFPYREKELNTSADKCTYKLPRSVFCYFKKESL